MAASTRRIQTTTGSASGGEEVEEICQIIKSVQRGTPLYRVKHRSLGHLHIVQLSEDNQRICYQSRVGWKCIPNKLKSIGVGEILEVRTGWNTDNFHRAAAKQNFMAAVKENQCFSIIFRHKILFHKSIDLVAENENEQKIWVRALSHLVTLQRCHTLHFNEEQWLIQHFRAADVNSNGCLTFSELWDLLNKLNLEISEAYGRKIFERSDINKTRLKFGECALDREEFLKFFRELTHRDELEQIMSLYSSGNADFLFPENLLKFIQNEQGVPDITLEQCKELIERFEPDDKNKEALMLGPNGFRKLLLSKWGCVMNFAHSVVFQDMHHPLPCYFIRSSHNTYLISGQLRGEASVEGYIIALKRGARLLEVDVWDGSDGEPIVTHGHTLVVPISLRDAVQAINNYAFVTSPYPVMITIENHCSIEQQRKMAGIFVEIFGKKLYRKRFDPSSSLKFRRRKRDKLATFPASLVAPGSNIGKRLPPNCVDSADAIEESDSVTEDEEEVGEEAGDLPDGLVMSQNETKVVVSDYRDIVRYTAGHLLKAFPKGLRTDSSNMNPVPLWLAGVQMDTHIAVYIPTYETHELRFSCRAVVAMRLYYTSVLISKRVIFPPKKPMSWELSRKAAVMCIYCASVLCQQTGATMNMQTAGLEMDLDNGLFQLNGFSGYVLKPKQFREGILELDEIENGREKLIVKVKIISAQYLPKPGPGNDDDIIDPYVTMEVFGFPCDCVKDRTAVVHNNGFNPRWNETFVFRFKVPEMALLRFCVKDYDRTSYNDFIGQYTLPVQCIRPGYSHVHLETGYSHSVDPSATLFIHVSVQWTTA